MVKTCKFDSSKRCYHSSCDFVDCFGDVRVCKYHLNPSGFFMRKKLVYLVGRK